MNKRFVIHFLFTICLLSLNIIAQEKKPDAIALPEIQASPWNLDYQISIQSLQSPQFADVIRKNILKPKNDAKKESEVEIKKRIIFEGEARIKAGKASTTFKYNDNLTLKDYLLMRADSPELRNIVEQYATTCIKLFRKKLSDEKLAQNDVVDAGALAFVISHEVFFGEKPTKNHLKWMRTKGREYLLRSANFQGVPDDERQRTFEIYGVLSMYAQVLQIKGLQGDLAAAKEAKETAAEVLKEVWGGSTDSIQLLPIGFIHKGQKIISDGKATQVFNHNSNLGVAKRLAGGNRDIAIQFQAWLDKFSQEMMDKQMSINDLAMCGTASFSMIYDILSGGSKINDDEASRVNAMFKRAVLMSSDIQAASDENKQMACESFAIRAMLIKDQAAKKTDPKELMPTVENFARDLFRAFGEDFEKYKMPYEKIATADSVQPKNQ